jgi:DNA ligase D-like protein (predicted 3'-phosphoesterase)
MSNTCQRRFVLHEHYASHHHFDFRLERNGVLKSWALPKGLPKRYGERHLAVQVNNHPMSYINFKGRIPEGAYGAGTVSIADNGCYQTIEWSNQKIVILLQGKNYKGEYILIPLGNKNQWIIMRVKEKPHK